MDDNKGEYGEFQQLLADVEQKNSLLEKSYSLLPICIWNHWQVVVICKQEDNDMSFLMLLDSLHMGEHTRIENELKNFLKIAYEGKGMTALADEMKLIDLHVPKVPQQKGSTECGFMVLYFIFRFILAAPTSFGRNDYPSFLTADWFSREEYEKFREDLQGKIIHIDAQSASTSKKRKFDVPISLRDFVMKDLNQKCRSWKYDLRTKFFMPYQKAQQHFACSDRRVVEDQWKKLVQIWSSEEFKFLKIGATLDRGDLFIRTRMKKAGGPVNDESAAMIDKIRDIKLTQQSTTLSSIASVGDAYEQVMGRERTGRIRGIGTGPTPKSLWGSRSEQKLRQDNESLKEKIEALEERMKKIESRGNNESSASVCHAQKKKDSLAGRRVRILNFSGEVVASGILISDDNDNVVMGKKLGGEYYEAKVLREWDGTSLNNVGKCAPVSVLGGELRVEASVEELCS
ncbi:hypothetical protein Taro_031253 [Colocasia esculenta]|uniref:Ubiquitin-like protease family profile domain-containing protein n=1 Tax=Colocasia esculenta TaxID=4460 RepID=A0A843W5V0_COLES|nr:hypothetical protein [Colocasia esculenta]